MRWVFENIQLLLAIAGVIAYWIVQTRKQKEEQEMAEEVSREPDSVEMEERARRVQEEIRRKIAERNNQPAPVEREIPPPLPVAPPPLAEVEADSAAGSEAAARPARELSFDGPDTSVHAEARADQQRAAAGGADMEVSRKASVQSVADNASIAQTQIGRTATAPAAVRRDTLLQTLRQPDSLRQAVLLREILGPAKGMRP